MTTLAKLKECDTRADLASFLGFKPKSLAYILFKIPDAEKYRTFEIEKKSGGVRTISAPVIQLKLLQSRLSKNLQECLTEIETYLKVREAGALSHGFHKKRSIGSNASMHLNKRWVFNLDIKNFFPSINFGRIRGFLMKNQYFSLNESVATTIAQIACYQNSLPQGAPCSPVISNLIANMMDIKIQRLARHSKCTYTRYADDLTFSTNLKEFPVKIAFEDTDSNAWYVGDALRHALFASGFEINHSKTRMQYRLSRQDVTGLVVNKTIGVPIQYRKRVRAQCHQLITTGSAYETISLWEEPAQVPLSPARLQGRLAHIHRFNQITTNTKRLPNPITSWPNHLRSYRHFLDYVRFGNNESPLIVCEGKTDNIHIKCAINSLFAQFPTLIQQEDEKEMIVKFFNYTSTTDTVQSLGGGLATYRPLCRNTNPD